MIYHYANTISYFIETYKSIFPIGPALNPSIINELSLVMVSAMMSNKIICHTCHNQYKNNMIKCLICNHQYIKSKFNNICSDCQQPYESCQYCTRYEITEKSIQSDIDELTENIKVLKAQVTTLTMQLNKPKRKKPKS